MCKLLHSFLNSSLFPDIYTDCISHAIRQRRMGLRDRRHEKSKTTIVSEKCIAGCACETHSQGIPWIHGFPHGTSKDTSHNLSVCVVFLLFFFSHLKLHREPKRTCSVEVELACFNISLKVSGTQTQVSVSNKQKSEFALWLNQKRALRFSTFLPSLQSAMWIRHYSLSLTRQCSWFLDIMAPFTSTAILRTTLHLPSDGTQTNEGSFQMMMGCERWNYYSTISGVCVYLSTRIIMQARVLMSASCCCSSNP